MQSERYLYSQSPYLEVDVQPLACLLILGVFLTQMLDASTTIYALSHGASESNPLTRTIITSYGPEGLVIYKTALAILICAGVIKLGANWGNKWMISGALFAMTITSTMIVSNLYA